MDLTVRRSIAALGCAGAILISGCESPPAPAVTPQPRADGVHVVFPEASPQLARLVIEPAAATDTVAANVPGRLIWDENRTVRIYPSFAGRVVRILAQVGDRVAAGQPLAEFASPEFGQAQADTRRAETDLIAAERNLKRMRELHEGGVAAQRELHAVEAEHARAETELTRTRARVQLYGGGSAINQSYLLRSPIPGVVVERNLNPGQEARPDQLVANAPPLFVVTDPTHLWVMLDAREKDLPLLRRGLAIDLRSATFGRETYQARIEQVADFIDPQARTVKVRGSVANLDRHLKAEMFVTAVVHGEAPAGVAVGAGAVFLSGDRHFAFVEREARRFERVVVTVGEESAGKVSVLTGIRPGDRVVVDGALLLQQILQRAGG